MTDLADRLSQDLKPVRPMRAWTLWAGGAVALAAAVTWILTTMGLRSELVYALHGLRLAGPMPVLKPLMFLVCGLSALWAVAGLTRPDGRLKLRYLVPVLAVVGLIVGNLASELARDGTAGMVAKLNGGAATCFSTILVGGLIGFAALWGLWLRKAATPEPAALGAMSGLACASLMASAYALHCNMDSALYVFFIYTAAVGIFTAFAAVVGGRWLKW